MINLKKMKMLEPGHVLEIGEGLIVDENRVVHIISTNGFYFRVGIIPSDNISWFEQSDRKMIIDNIKTIVYIEEGVWSIKHMTQPLDEFNKLSDFIKEDIISKYVELMDE